MARTTTINFGGEDYKKVIIDKHIVELTPVYSWGRLDSVLVEITERGNRENTYSNEVDLRDVRNMKNVYKTVGDYEISYVLRNAGDGYEFEYSESLVPQGGCMLW